MLRVMAGLAALAVCTTVVLAQNAAGIDQRQQAMKTMSGAMKNPTAMVKGEAPFDLAKVQASLKTIRETAIKARNLFPDNTMVGKTDALPVAFEKRADVMARLDKLAADAKAVSAAVKDEATLKAQWKNVGANCGGCHKVYRKPKS